MPTSDKFSIVIELLHSAAQSGAAKIVSSFGAIAASIAIADRAMEALSKGFSTGFNAVEEFNKNIASTAALILSFQNQTANLNVAEQYRLAVNYSKELVPVLKEIADTTLVGLTEVQSINTALITQGQLFDANNKEQVEAIKSLSNAFGVLVGDSSQAQQEFNALLKGQVDENSKLAKFANNQVGNLKEQVALWKDQGTLLENLGKLFSSFGVAAKDLENTWQTISSTLETTAKDILGKSMLIAYQDIVSNAQELNTLIKEHEDTIIRTFVTAYVFGRRTIESIRDIWITISELPIVKQAFDFQKAIATAELKLFGLSAERLSNFNKEKSLQEEIAEAQKQINKFYDDGKKAVSETSERYKKLKENVKETKNQSAELRKEFESLSSVLELEIQTKGFTEIQKNIFSLVVEYEKLKNKFKNEPLIDEAYSAKVQKIIDDFTSSYVDKQKDSYDELLESEKTLAQERLQTQTDYYDELIAKNTIATDSIKNKTIEINNLEKLLSTTRRESSNLQLELLSKNLSSYETYTKTQELLEQQLKDAAELSGEAKVEALREYQEAVSDTAQEVRDGNVVFKSESDATKIAIDQIASAQKLIEEEIRNISSARQQDINQTVKWSNSLVEEANRVTENIAEINEQMVYFDYLLSSSKSVNIDTDSAYNEIIELSNFLNNYIPDVIYKTLVIDVQGEGSARLPIGEKIKEIQNKFNNLSSQANIGIDTNGVDINKSNTQSKQFKVENININVSTQIDERNLKSLIRNISITMQEELNRLTLIK